MTNQYVVNEAFERYLTAKRENTSIAFAYGNKGWYYLWVDYPVWADIARSLEEETLRDFADRISSYDDVSFYVRGMTIALSIVFFLFLRFGRRLNWFKGWEAKGKTPEEFHSDVSRLFDRLGIIERSETDEEIFDGEDVDGWN